MDDFILYFSVFFFLTHTYIHFYLKTFRMSTSAGQEKYQEMTTTTIMTESTHVIENSKSREELYQGRNSSSTQGSQEDNVATLEVPQENTPAFNFKTRRELIDFSVLMVGVIFAMFMMSLNSTVVAPAMSIIATELNGLESQTWIATAYLVALNTFQPLSGRVSLLISIYIYKITNIFFFFYSFLIFLEGNS